MNLSAPPPAALPLANPPARSRPPAGSLANTRSAVRAILFKELYPNFLFVITVYIVLAMFAFIPPILEALRHGPSNRPPENILSNPTFQIFLWPLFAVIGMLTGIVMGRQSRDPDQWAFLIHRPISQVKLVGGWLLAAGILYAFAAGGPMLCVMMHAAVSRGYPYHWRYNLPVLAGFGGGFLLCIAALLTMQRRAIIFGSAGMPLVAGAVGVLAVAISPTFPAAVLVLVAFAVLLAVTTLGAQATNGYLLRARAIPRLALALTLLIAFTAILAPSAFYLKVYSYRVFPFLQIREFEEFGMRPRRNETPFRRVEHTVLPDGRLGRFVTEVDEGAKLTRSYVSDEPPFETLPLDLNMGWRITAQSTAAYIALSSDVRSYTMVDPIDGNVWTWKGNEVWYFIRSAGVFRGYDRLSGERLGTVDALGEVTAGRSVHPLRHDQWTRTQNPNDMYFAGPRGLYLVNPVDRTSSLIAELPEGEIARGWSVVRDYSPSGKSPIDFTAVITDRTVQIFEPGALKPSVSLPAGRIRNGSITVYRFPAAGRWVVRTVERGMEGDVVGFQAFDAAGNRVASKDGVNDFTTTEWSPYMNAPPEPSPMTRYVSGIADGVTGIAGLYLTFSAISYTIGQDNMPPKFLLPQTQPRYLWPAAAVTLITTLATWLLARLCGARAPWLWVLSALVFGVAALLVLLSTHTIRKRTKCPACGTPQYLSDERCPKCGAGHPLPPSNATEIFAAARPSP